MAHYMTEELLVHAGINHLLTLYLLFPHLPVKNYSLRNTGNRGIEAFHSIFRGGTATLPITGANLSFQEFLCLMNKVGQIAEAEHELKKIDGNSIVAPKKKKKTCARDSSDKPSQLYTTYKKPDNYEKFVKELEDACVKGEEEAKTIISKLAPHMKKKLKEEKQWDKPEIAIEIVPHSSLKIIKKDKSEICQISPMPHDKIVDSLLGSITRSRTQVESNPEANPEIDSAYANLLTDLTIEDETQCSSSVLKGLQPFRERPSKDRSRRFAAGELPFDKTTSCEHDIINYTYWCIKPINSRLSSAHLFLLGQILCIMQDEKAVDSSIKSCPNTQVVLNVYCYDPELEVYLVSGRSGLLKANSILLCDVTDLVKATADGNHFDHTMSPMLIGYEPFHAELDLSLLTAADSEEDEGDSEDEPYIVEKIVKKRFNGVKTQYEYLIKWLGYSSKENTWELPSNIPQALLNEYEQSLMDHSSSDEPPRRAGLRDRSSRKLTKKPDFIVNK